MKPVGLAPFVFDPGPASQMPVVVLVVVVVVLVTRVVVLVVVVVVLLLVVGHPSQGVKSPNNPELCSQAAQFAVAVGL